MLFKVCIFVFAFRIRDNIALLLLRSSLFFRIIFWESLTFWACCLCRLLFCIFRWLSFSIGLLTVRLVCTLWKMFMINKWISKHNAVSVYHSCVCSVTGFSQLNRVEESAVNLLTYEQCMNATSQYAFATLRNTSMICASLQPAADDICYVRFHCAHAVFDSAVFMHFYLY